MTHREPVPRLFLRFLRFGALAWGGPVAQIAMIRRDLVEQERWIDAPRFNRVLAVYQALPGPEAHELCVYFGRMAAGTWGGVVAGLGFMLPGFLLMLLLSWAYVRYGLDARVLTGAFAFLQAGVLALIVRGANDIGRHALGSGWLVSIAAAVLLASLAGAHFAVILVAAGAVHVLASRGFPVAAVAAAGVTAALIVLVPGLREAPAAVVGATGPPGEASLAAIAVAGLAAGLLTFGGAYTAIPILRQQAVGPGGWMTPSGFLDGLALGGLLPAPLIIFSTFVGYVGAGFPGAVLMTAAVFLPAFAFTLVGHRHLERLVAEPRLHALFDGITAGVVGLIAATTIRLAPEAIPGPPQAVVAALALGVLLVWRRKRSIPVVLASCALAGVAWDRLVA